jgi:hypothetical protein
LFYENIARMQGSSTGEEWAVPLGSSVGASLAIVKVISIISLVVVVAAVGGDQENLKRKKKETVSAPVATVFRATILCKSASAFLSDFCNCTRSSLYTSKKIQKF